MEQREILRTNVKLSFRTKLCFAMGDIYSGGFFNLINFFYAYFLTDVMRINPVWAGAIFTVSKIWDAVTDPLMGVISDRTKSRWGRRRPYFLWGIPLILLSFTLMWFPLSGGTEASRVLFFALAYMLANTVATFVQVPFLSMTAEISTDYRERNSISGIRMFVSLCSSLVCAVVPMLIVGMYQDVRTGYFVMAVVFGLFFALPWLLVFRVKEPPVFSMAAERNKGVFRPMLQTFRVRSFRKLIYVYLGIFVTMDLVSMIMAYFMTYIIGRPDELTFVLGALLICEVVMIPLATLCTNRFGKLKAVVWGCAGWAAVCLGMLALNSAQPGWCVYALACAAGMVMAFPLVGIISLFGDVTDVGELYFSRRMEGAFFGMQQLTRKCASAVANGVTLALLGLAGYVTPPEGLASVAQAPPVLLCIRLIMSLTAPVLLIPSIIVACTWKLTPERHARLIQYLDKKRAGAPVSAGEEAEAEALKRIL
ncbi:MAG: MFS transporter [Clostridia bacterium]|nr:MFS transporter [Clostridia bacterium]